MKLCKQLVPHVFMSVMKAPILKYPIGIQSFEKIRNDGYLYVDKTDLVYKLVSEGNYYFLSRPRRFGKSLLLNTIEEYFKGRRDLFKGLAIDSLTNQWECHPVLHLDLNTSKYNEISDLYDIVDNSLKKWEEEYQITDIAPSLALRFGHIIETAKTRTGMNVVILIDEYDKPLTESILDSELSDKFRDELRALYSNLKTQDRHIRFAMITRVTRFSRMTIFSGLNNLEDISINEDYEAVCGITESELSEVMSDGIDAMAMKYSLSRGQTMANLREWYDGYRFSENRLDIYNPFSLLNALKSRKLGSYWFLSGTPLFLARLLTKNEYRFDTLQSVDVDQYSISQVDSFMTNPIALLLQTGYLSIREWIPESNEFRLGFPNREVKEGFLDYLYKYIIAESGIRSGQDAGFSIARFREDVIDGDPEGFMRRLDSLMSTLNLDPRGNLEAHYQNAVYLVFSLMGFMAGIEVHSARGRSDMTVVSERFVFIFEFKTDASAQTAVGQIADRRYDAPYAAFGKTIFRIGVNFDTSLRRLTPWIIEKV